jgi:hypothetical protein
MSDRNLADGSHAATVVLSLMSTLLHDRAVLPDVGAGERL